MKPVYFGPVIAGAMVAGADGALPKRVKIAAWGVNVARGLGDGGADATFTVGNVTAASLPVNQVKRGYDTVTLDFEHQTHKGHANFKAGPVQVAGHGRITCETGQGIFFDVTSYTPTGREYAANYPDVSGVFWTNAAGEVVLVSSVALTLAGAVEGAEFREALAASVIAAMTAEAEGCLERLVADLLGFDESATSDDLTEGLERLLEARRDRAEVMQGDASGSGGPAMQTKSGGRMPATQPQQQPQKEPTMDPEISKKLDALTEAVSALAKGQQTLAASVQTIQQASDDSRHNAAMQVVIEAATREGKVVPASLKAVDAKGRFVMNAEQATEIMACIPATVNVGQTATAKAGAGEEGISAVEREVMLACGLTEEQWKAKPIIADAGRAMVG